MENSKMKQKKMANYKQSVRVFFGRGLIIKISFAVVIFFVLAAIFGPLLTPYTPYAVDTTNIYASPSAEHLLGTDNIGRDFLTRILYGARISLITSLVSSIWGGIVGVILGLIAGYSKGIISSFIMRIIDAQLSIPSLILTMVLAMLISKDASKAQRLLSISLVIGIGAIPSYTRMVYGLVLSIKTNDYVISASLAGQSSMKILFKHLLPNCFASLIVIFTMSLGIAIMVEAGLAYLGVGITAPEPAWGLMVSEGYKYFETTPRLAILPGLCVMLVVIAFNIVGDGLRDALDPRLRGKL